MSATISSAGTWSTITGLSLGLSGQAGPAGLNRPIALGLNFESLKTQDGVILSELEQFIQLAATNYGLSFWSAADLIEILMRAMRERNTPMQLGDANGTRFYAP